jgi:hypothetical protein
MNMRFGLILATQVCALALVGQAAAQSPKPSRNKLVAQVDPAAPPPATDATPAPAPAEPAMPAFVEPPPEPPAPPPPPPPPPPPADKPLFRFYGIVKPTIVVANALESFGQQNFVAPTAVANPVFVADQDDMAWSFQAQQTRFGVAVGEGLPVTAKLEIDFIDSALIPGFNRSSPAQATTPRLRQAYLEWTMLEGHKLTMGQLWDFFSPLNNHTYNLVGNLFQSGNVGFMRHQLAYTGVFGPIEASLALGLTAQNLGPALNQVEYGKMPTIVPRVGYRKGKELWAGVSGMVSRVSFAMNTPAEDTHIVWGGNLFADATLFSKLNLRAEAYFGQNLNNLGVLGLANAVHAADPAPEYDLKEAGGWVSAKFTATPQHAAHVVVGGAAVLDSDDLPPAYTAGTPAMGMAPAVAPTRNGVGIQSNISLRAGYSYTPYAGFSLVAEPFIIITKHQLAPAEEALFDETRKGGGVEFGGLYSF